MPWKVEDVDRFKKGLTKTQKKQWVKIANSSFKRCAAEGEKTDLDCEVSAIRIANAKYSDTAFSVSENTCPGIPGINFKKLQEVSLQEAEVTDEYQMILPVGLFFSRWYGEIIITESFCQAMVDNWKNKVLREQQPFVDTEHDRGKANGWLQDMEARADGLYAKIEWTPLGVEQVGGGLYKYLSADIDSVLDIDTNEEIYPVLIAVALCNTPVMKTMPPVHLQDKPPTTPTQVQSGEDLGVLALSIQSAIMRLYNPAHSDGVQNDHKDKDMDELLKLFMALSDEEKASFAKTLSDALKKTEGEGNQEPGTGAELPNTAAGAADPPAGGDPAKEAQDKKLAELAKQNQVMAKQLSELLKVKGEPITVETPVTGNVVADARMQALEKANLQMSEQINTILSRDKAEKKKAFIELNLKEGRILPKDVPFWEDKFDRDPEGVPEILKRTPSVTIFNEEGTGADGSSFKLNETAEEKRIREKMNLSVEDAATYGEGYKPVR